MQSQIELVKPSDAPPDGLFSVSDALIEENLRSLSLAGITVRAAQMFDMSLIEEIYAGDPVLKSGPVSAQPCRSTAAHSRGSGTLDGWTVPTRARGQLDRRGGASPSQPCSPCCSARPRPV